MSSEPLDGLLTVGVVARRSGLTAKVLRHYDRVGLLTTADELIRRHRRRLDALITRMRARCTASTMYFLMESRPS